VTDLIRRKLASLGFEIRRIRPDATGRPRRTNFGEQAILNGIVAGLPDFPRQCVDIGAGDGLTHSNSLDLFEQGFSGAACEGNGERFARLAYLHRQREDIRLGHFFVTPDNIIPWLKVCRLPKDFGVLSLDIDGYDHFVLARILSAYRPGLLCLEVNEKIPPPVRFTVLWRPDWVWDGGHCFGQSLSAAWDLCRSHGYQFVALEYNNAFFVRSDWAAGSKPSLADLTAEQGYQQGYLSRPDRLQRLPWNRDVEDVLSLSPEAAVKRLDQVFAARRGRYAIACEPLSDADAVYAEGGKVDKNAKDA